MELLTKPSQGLPKVLITVLTDIHRQILFSKKIGLLCPESACSVTSFHVAPNHVVPGPNSAALQGQCVPPLGYTLMPDVTSLKCDN